MSQQQRTVLIVDDSPEDRELYRRYLLRDRDYLYNILEAELGQQGLELWQQHQPDLILLDYRLPDLDGLEFLTRLLAQQSFLPIIMVTGQGNESISVRAMKAGAQDYLVKEQITPERLHLAVNSAIETMKLRAELQQRIERERLIAQITQKIYQNLELQEILQTTVTEVRQFLKCDRVFIYRFDSDFSGMAIVESVDDRWLSVLNARVEDRYFRETRGEDYRRGQIQVVADINTASLTECHFKLLNRFQVRANLAVPILHNSALWGLLVANHCSAPYQWQPLEIDLLKQLTTQVGIALQQKELDRQVRAELTERQQTEERFCQLAENIDAVFWITEFPERRLSYVSPACDRLWGVNPQHLCQDYRNWLDLLHPDDRAATDKAFAEKALDGRFDEEYRIILPDGRIRWVRDRCFPVRDEIGRVYRLAGIVEDITEQQQAKQERQQLVSLVENSSDFIGIASLEGKLLFINQAGMQLVGLESIESLQHIRLPDFFFSEDWDYVERHQIPTALTQGQWIGEYRFKHFQTGTAIAVDCNVFPIRDTSTNQIIAIATVTRDIRERQQAGIALRQSEERYRQLVELCPDGIFVGVNKHFVFANRAALELFRATKPDELIGKSVLELVCPAYRDIVNARIERLLQGQSVPLIEEQFLRLDGTIADVEVAAIPFIWNGQQGAQVAIRDITDRKQAEIERDRLFDLEQLARQEAERANRIKDEFLAVLSHELRSPLNPILGWTKLMQSYKFDRTRTAQALDAIERNAKVQIQLIDDLLDVGRILRGKLNLNVLPINLAVAIEQAIETVTTAAVAKSIQIYPYLPQNEYIRGDSARLQQIVWNLLSNAIKFTPKGGRVDIRLERIDDQAQITVTDNGKGINPDFLPYIFETFRQEDSSISRKHGGLGLGLGIVRYLVEAHGGTVRADSLGEGRGATFTVRLPRLENTPATEPTERLLEEGITLTGIRVLAIDDEPDTRELVKILLEQYGAEVIAVASAAEFMTALNSFYPNVAIVDLGMPEIDGYTLIEQVRALLPETGGQTPAIAFTAYASELDRQKALSAGFQLHLTKPIEPDLLIEAVIRLTIGTTHNKR
jgi:PAS domain S-box-containing protein